MIGFRDPYYPYHPYGRNWNMAKSTIGTPINEFLDKGRRAEAERQITKALDHLNNVIKELRANGADVLPSIRMKEMLVDILVTFPKADANG